MRAAMSLSVVLLFAGSCDSARSTGDRGARADALGDQGQGSADRRLTDGARGQEPGSTKLDAPPGGCTIFPADNPWNTDISGNKVHANSANFISSIGAGTGLHADFGTVWAGAPNGIPFVEVPGNQAKVPITFTAYGDQSDPGPYPIPLDAPIEGGPSATGDRHVIAVDRTNCMLYELGNGFPGGTGWKANCGAIFNLKSNNLRTIGWTSADAAGLPIFPGLVRYEEVKAGAINHAIRFTVNASQNGYVLPATHYAGSSGNANLPPMGLRLRLKASYNISGFSKDIQVILTAFKKYGIINADNGSSWYISGAPNPLWSDDDLATLSKVKGSDFEVVDTGPIKTSY